MYMGVLIQHPNFSVVYDFSATLAESVHRGLQRLQNNDFSTPFYWYSLIMHMFLFRNADFFAESMELKRKNDEENFPVQLWTTDFSYNREKFSWKGQKKDVLKYVQECMDFQRNKVEKNHLVGFLQPLPIPNKKWASILMDFIIGLPKAQGKDCIYVVVDRLTKYAHFLSIST
jgi:hypothetical protein